MNMTIMLRDDVIEIRSTTPFTSEPCEPTAYIKTARARYRIYYCPGCGKEIKINNNK